MVFINIRRKMNKLSKNKWDYDLITSSLVCKFVKKIGKFQEEMLRVDRIIR
jgi:hypothetical protein